MSSQAPTAGQVLDTLVKRFAPPYDPTLPFHDTVAHAKRRLAVSMLEEAFGPQHPLSRFAASWATYESVTQPSAELCEGLIEDMEIAWGEIEITLRQQTIPV